MKPRDFDRRRRTRLARRLCRDVLFLLLSQAAVPAAYAQRAQLFLNPETLIEGPADRSEPEPENGAAGDRELRHLSVAI